MTASYRRPARTVAIAFVLAALAAACGSNRGEGGSNPRSTAEAATASSSPTPAPVERSPIDGQYTTTLTKHDVQAAGVPKSVANQVVGVWRVTFSFGYAQQFVNLGGTTGITSDGYHGGFSVAGDRLTLTDQAPLTFKWRLTGRKLSLDLVDPASADPVDGLIWTAHSWDRVGDD